MKQKSEEELLTEFDRHSTGNRDEIEVSKYAGCAACCSTFDAKDVRAWQDEWVAPEKQNRVKRWTAQCPSCGQPSVIGSSTGLLENPAYLPVVNHILNSKRR
jgi:hypothetical protein